MTIEEKLEVVRKALEKGASVSLNFFDCESEEQAEEMIKPLSNDFKKDFTYEGNSDLNWIELVHETDDEIEVEVVAFYESDKKGV